MEKRLVLAIGLSALILFMAQMLFHKPPVQKQLKEISSEKEVSLSAVGTQALTLDSPAIEDEVKKPGLSISEEELLVKTNFLEVKLDKWGKLDDWKLLDFGEKDGRRVDLTPPPLQRAPLGLKLGEKELVPIMFLSPTSRIKEFIYESSGLKITKRFIFAPDTYVVKLELCIENQTTQSLQVMKANGFSLQWTVPSLDKGELAQALKYHSHLDTIEQACLVDQKKKVIGHGQNGILDGILAFLGFVPGAKPEDESKREVGSIAWVSQASKYFLNVIIPETPLEEVIFSKTREGELTIELPLNGFVLPAGQSITKNFNLYGGPRDDRVLETISSNLRKLTSMWAVPLVIRWILNFFYKITHNYGVAIILLTIVIKIILHPLTRKNFLTMKNMQKIQPHMATLKEKHKDDKEALNREMMELYKRHKVNPLGGCLPLLLQMPVFFALFATLNTAIELRGAGFIFWLQDLSSKDPYFILPVLMGATMLLQQKMTPAADPNQAKMGMFMSIFFIFMFMSFPSGLVLYWLVQNILTILEQYLINKGLEK